MEALARFMADPESHIRRYAARIATREAAKRFGMNIQTDTLVIIMIPSSRVAPIAPRRVLIPP